MQLYGALILLVTLSTACGWRCYTCLAATNAKSCTDIKICGAEFDSCFSLNVYGIITKGCQNSNLCVGGINCCSGDLCNSAISTGSSVVLLLLSSVIITVFL